MKLLIINPTYVTAISKYGTRHQAPFGLLMIGGAMIDDGHDVSLLDAEAQFYPPQQFP
jgi:anaerobic magnesium-protoporphyrin IX monomethyl ester cyclase